MREERREKDMSEMKNRRESINATSAIYMLTNYRLATWFPTSTSLDKEELGFLVQPLDLRKRLQEFVAAVKLPVLDNEVTFISV